MKTMAMPLCLVRSIIVESRILYISFVVAIIAWKQKTPEGIMKQVLPN